MADEASAKEEAKKHIEERSVGYSNAEVVIKLQGWDANHSKTVAQASLRALKQLVQSDKQLPSKNIENSFASETLELGFGYSRTPSTEVLSSVLYISNMIKTNDKASLAFIFGCFLSK